jgi:hypothetical protein
LLSVVLNIHSSIFFLVLDSVMGLTSIQNLLAETATPADAH